MKFEGCVFLDEDDISSINDAIVKRVEDIVNDALTSELDLVMSGGGEPSFTVLNMDSNRHGTLGRFTVRYLLTEDARRVDGATLRERAAFLRSIADELDKLSNT